MTMFTINQLIGSDWNTSSGIATYMSEAEAGQTPWKRYGIDDDVFNLIYTVNSGDRVLAKNIDTLDKLKTMCRYIYKKNYQNWNKLADTMFIEYNVMDNYDLTETETIRDKTTKNDTVTDVKNGTASNTKKDTGTIDTVVNGETKNTGTVGTLTNNTSTNTEKDTGTSTSEKTETGSYKNVTVRDNGADGYKVVSEKTTSGFDGTDATTYRPSEKESQTTTGSYTDTMTHTPTSYKESTTDTPNLTKAITGESDVNANTTQNLTENIDNTNTETHNLTITDSGTTTENNSQTLVGGGTGETTRELRRKGNIGVNTTQDQIRQERGLWSDFDLIDYIMKDIDKDLTIPAWGCIM
jgi:hypothetical protein